MDTGGATLKLYVPFRPAVAEPAGVQSAAPAGRASSERAAPESGEAPVLIVPLTVAFSG